jgi:hypothetical protein
MFKKLFFITALVAILATAALPATSALALTTRIVGFATVNKSSVVTSLPASFRLRGTYTCDRVQINSSVSGKTITIYVYNIKIKGGGNTCANEQAYNRVINVGTLVPGNYTVLINPDGNGKPQKKFFFTAPMLPTPTPAPTKP